MRPARSCSVRSPIKIVNEGTGVVLVRARMADYPCGATGSRRRQTGSMRTFNRSLPSAAHSLSESTEVCHRVVLSVVCDMIRCCAPC